jgi:hypothetical protein
MNTPLLIAGIICLMAALIAVISVGLARLMRIQRRSLAGLDALARRPDLTHGDGP